MNYIYLLKVHQGPHEERMCHFKRGVRSTFIVGGPDHREAERRRTDVILYLCVLKKKGGGGRHFR